MKLLTILLLACTFSVQTHAQFFKKKSNEAVNDSTPAAAEESKRDKKGKPSLLTKVITKVAKVAGGTMQTSSTDDLNSIVPSVWNQNNICPGNLGTAEMAFYENWKTSGNMVVLMFTKKNSTGFTKIDGDVTIDGKPAEFATMGVYSAFSGNLTKPQVVEITTKKGDKSSFTINPPKYAVKVKSINGSAAETIKIDPSKDMVLELDNQKGSENTVLTVKILAKSAGMKYWSDLGFFPSADKITIPAAYFRNLNNPNSNGMTNYKDSYIQIIRMSREKATNVSGNFKEVEYENNYEDGRYLEIKPDIENSKGVTVTGSNKFEEGNVNYEFSKSNAFSSRLFSNVKSIGTVSFALRGITYDHKQNTKYNIGGNSYTTTTKTLQFPQLPDEQWDFVLENLYKNLTTVLKEELKVNIEPIEKVKATDAYARMEQFSKDDANTKVEVSRGYKGLKVISNFVPVTESWGPNSNMAKLIKESGINAILKATLDFEVAWDGSKGVLVPKLAVELIGPNNGDLFPTKYFTSLVIGKGFPFDKVKNGSKVLEVFRIDDLTTQFRKGLKELMAKEKENGDYDVIWGAK